MTSTDVSPWSPHHTWRRLVHCVLICLLQMSRRKRFSMLQSDSDVHDEDPFSWFDDMIRLYSYLNNRKVADRSILWQFQLIWRELLLQSSPQRRYSSHASPGPRLNTGEEAASSPDIIPRTGPVYSVPRAIHVSSHLQGINELAGLKCGLNHKLPTWSPCNHTALGIY